MNLQLIKFRKINLNQNQTVEDWLTNEYNQYEDENTRFTFINYDGEIEGESTGASLIKTSSSIKLEDITEIDISTGDNTKVLNEKGNFVAQPDTTLINLPEIDETNGDENKFVNEKGLLITEEELKEYTPDVYMLYAADIYYKALSTNVFENAWADMKNVQTVNRASYPNGETNGVIIPYGTTSIGGGAFQNWTSNNKPLVIPNSVVSIDYSAFYNWPSNTHQLIIPNSVTSIGEGAFYNWRANNQPLVISEGVTSIGPDAFYDWYENTHPLVIPESITSIGRQAFSSWPLVPHIIMKSATPPIISYNTFDNQNNASIYVPDASLAAYKSAANWSTLEARIKPISELEGAE